MRKRILYCVLDWGLGHATRSIPIIRSLLDRGCDIILASDSLALEFLREEFPTLLSYGLPSYDVKYKSNHLLLNGIYNWKNIRSAIRAEHELIAHISKKEKIDALISDNRYGCQVAGLPCVMVTHQLQFRTGNALQDWFGQIAISKLLKPFDRIWVPDVEERTLSGVLSMSTDKRVRCIGWQSTLTNRNQFCDGNEAESGKSIDVSLERHEEFQIVAILSGPEPLRTSFEKEIHAQFKSLDTKCAIVRGAEVNDSDISEGNVSAQGESNVTVYHMLSRKEIENVMNSSSVIVCRSGYSSLMDLQTVGKKAILIPTPGQPEQKYLAERLRSSQNYVVQQQGHLDIESAIDKLANINITIQENNSSQLLDNAIEDLFKIA